MRNRFNREKQNQKKRQDTELERSFRVLLYDISSLLKMFSLFRVDLFINERLFFLLKTKWSEAMSNGPAALRGGSSRHGW